MVNSGHNLSQTAVQTSPRGINQPWDPETTCVLIPLGSPTGLQKRPYVHAPVVPGLSQQRRWHRYGSQGGTRVGIPGGVVGGLYRVLPSHLESGGSYQRSGPRKPHRGWSGWVTAAAPARAQNPPLRGPVGTLQGPSLVLTSPRLLANRDEIPTSIS